MPFDLQGALSGASVVTRKGWKVLDIVCFVNKKMVYPLQAYVEVIDDEPEVFSFTKDGKYYSDSENRDESDYDLFMQEEVINQIEEFYLPISQLQGVKMYDLSANIRYISLDAYNDYLTFYIKLMINNGRIIKCEPITFEKNEDK